MKHDLCGLLFRCLMIPLAAGFAGTALAQAWRGTRAQAQLARALRHCTIASFDAVARAVGELCGRTRTSDICDAHVALVAATRGDVLYTSDPQDMRRLLASCGRRRPIIVRC